jgi:6-pyruvoyltetrahydropterin/6-carboxytetrahydropterin synthase
VYEVTVEQTFSAAHHLRDYSGPCEHQHGHNFKVQVTIEGERLNRAGMLVDFADVKRVLRAIMALVDHRDLNEIPPFDAEKNPTAENIAEFFHARLTEGLANPEIRVREVRVWETEKQSASYRA